MAALNPEIIKDTKSLISFYQKNPRFKMAFDKIVANNINATYHGRPVKLYVEVLKNVTSKYKQEYSQVRKIVLHDTEGKVGELFNKVNPNTDFTLLDQAYAAALKGKNIINEKNIKERGIEEINKIEKDAKGNFKEKRLAYEKREEKNQIQEEKPIIPGESPENKKSYNPASLPNIPRVSDFKQFVSNPRTYVSNIFKGGATAGKVVATGVGRAIGKMGIQTAVKAGIGLGAKLGASLLAGAATGGVGLIIGVAASLPNETKKLFKLIFWIVIGLIAFIIVMFVFQRGEKMNSLLPPYDIPVMGSVNQVPVLPSVLPPAPYNWTAIKNRILREVNRYPSNIDIYKQAAQITGISWQVLAGIHSVEGSSNPNQSLVSGRIIGSVEPDIPIFSCSKNLGDTALQPGEPVKIGSGCGFASLLDTAIYAGNHLKDKNNGRIPQSFEEFVFALAGYNGWGNTNCNHNTPYANTSSCPPSFPGEDHPHPMNWYDNRHSTMYIVYCSDGVQCQTPVVYQNPSVMAVVRALAE